jgi:hypothetical protein
VGGRDGERDVVRGPEIGVAQRPLERADQVLLEGACPLALQAIPQRDVVDLDRRHGPLGW